MAIKRRGIVAVPGPYMFGENQELTTAEELKLAAERYPSIPLTIGHPAECKRGERPLPEHVVGRVHQKWFSMQNRTLGDFMIFQEKVDQIPPEILEKFEHHEPIAVSPGILRDIDRSNNIMRNMEFTHIALLNDKEDPRCPLGTCGVNLRLDSLSIDNGRQREMLLGQKTELREEKETPKEPVPKPKPVVEEKPAQETAKEPQHKPVEEKPEVEIPKKEPVKIPETPLVPEVIIPVPASSTPSQEWETHGTVIKYVPRTYRTKEKTQ